MSINTFNIVITITIEIHYVYIIEDNDMPKT